MKKYYFSYSYEKVTEEDVKNAVKGTLMGDYDHYYWLENGEMIEIKGDGRYYDSNDNLYEEIKETRDNESYISVGFVRR